MCSSRSSPFRPSLFISRYFVVPRDTWALKSRGYLSSFCLQRRDVVTVECGIACQRRHSGWTQWSNRGMTRGKEKRGGKMIGPRVHLAFTSIHSTQTINFHQTSGELPKTIKQAAVRANSMWFMSSSCIHTHKHTIRSRGGHRSEDDHRNICYRANPLYISHRHAAPPLYAPRPLRHHRYKSCVCVWMDQWCLGSTPESDINTTIHEGNNSLVMATEKVRGHSKYIKRGGTMTTLALSSEL